MKVTCPRCSVEIEIEIDPATHAALTGHAHFACPACIGTKDNTMTLRVSCPAFRGFRWQAKSGQLGGWDGIQMFVAVDKGELMGGGAAGDEGIDERNRFRRCLLSKKMSQNGGSIEHVGYSDFKRKFSPDPRPDPERKNMNSPIRHTLLARPIPTRMITGIRAIGFLALFATNEQRALHKRPPLVLSPALQRAAQLHSRDMAVGGFFAHDNPRDRARRTPWQRMAAEGVAGGYRSENIAKSFVNRHSYLSAADAIVAMWMKSPGHRRNLLDPGVRFLGCGVHACRCKQFHLFATQNSSSSAPP